MNFWKKIYDIQKKNLEKKIKFYDSKLMRTLNNIAIFMVIIIAIIVIIGFAIFYNDSKTDVKPKVFNINNIFIYTDGSGYYQNISVSFNDINNTIIINIPTAYIVGSGGYRLMNLNIVLYDENKKELLTYTNYDDTFLNPQEIVYNYKIVFDLNKNIKKENIKYISLEHEIEPKPQPINTAGTIAIIFMILVFGSISIITLVKSILKIKKGIIVTGEVINSSVNSYYNGECLNIKKIVSINYYIGNESYACEDTLPYFYLNTDKGKKYKVLHDTTNPSKSKLLINIISIITFGIIFLGATLMMIYNLLRLLLIL